MKGASMRLNKNELRKMILKEMHDHVLVDAEPESSWHTERQPDGTMDYEDSDAYEESGMIKSNLFNIATKAMDMHDSIQDGDDLPEWVQEKIAVCASMMRTLHDYLSYEMVKDELHEEKKDGRVKSRKYQGKEYQATPAMVKAVKKGASYKQLAKMADWADEPAAVVQAAKIVAKGKPMKKDDDLDEADTVEPWQPLKQSTGIMFFEEDDDE
jgi:hypothetical protein